MHTTAILDRLVAVNLDVRIWSGRKKLTAEDLSLEGDIPPEDLVSLGSKRVCDPEAVRVFQRLKRHAERVCLEGGMRFLGGFAIPEARTDVVAAALDGLAADFAAERQRFVAGYSQLIEDWVAQHPRWEAAIRRAVEPASRVESRLAFAYQLYRVAPVADQGRLAAEVAGLGDTLFQEVAQIARELDQSFIGKDALSQRALATFRRIREKLGCLAFVDYRVEPVRRSLDDWLTRTPAKGPVTGALFNEGFGLMLLVSDPQKMSDHGAGLLALQALIPSPEKDDDDCECYFGGPLGDFPDEDDTPHVPDLLPEEAPARVESFYF